MLNEGKMKKELHLMFLNDKYVKVTYVLSRRRIIGKRRKMIWRKREKRRKRFYRLRWMEDPNKNRPYSSKPLFNPELVKFDDETQRFYSLHGSRMVQHDGVVFGDNDYNQARNYKSYNRSKEVPIVLTHYQSDKEDVDIKEKKANNLLDYIPLCPPMIPTAISSIDEENNWRKNKYDEHKTITLPSGALPLPTNSPPSLPMMMSLPPGALPLPSNDNNALSPYKRLPILELKPIRVSEVMQSMFNADLAWLKTGNAPLWNLDKTIQFIYRNSNYILDVPRIEWSCFDPKVNLSFSVDSLIVLILDLYPKNLFLCGGAVTDMIRGKHNGIKDYDIFFCCDSYAEAEIILGDCITRIMFTRRIDSYDVSLGVVTVHLDDRMTIQFIRRLYEKPSDILLGFDLWACQHGWNPELGYFTLPTGAFSLAFGGCPVDTSRRSKSFDHRLEKYYKKEFRIFLPGVDKDHDKPIIAPGGQIYVVCCKGKCYSDMEMRNSTECKWDCQASVFRFYSDFGAKGEVCDYEESTTEYNYERLKENRLDKITAFSLEIYKDVKYMTREMLDLSLGFDWSENDEFKEYEPRIQCLLERLNTPELRWKKEIVGAPSFGTFSPIKEPPNKWYGFDKPIYYVGLNQDTFRVLYHMWKQTSLWKMLPRDIFRIICNMVFLFQGETDFLRMKELRRIQKSIDKSNPPNFKPVISMSFDPVTETSEAEVPNDFLENKRMVTSKKKSGNFHIMENTWEDKVVVLDPELIPYPSTGHK